MIEDSSMDGPRNFFEQLVGALLILAVLTDIFLTVLYARIGSGIISHRVACLMWWIFRTVAKPMRRWRNYVLSVCGPSILVVMVALWVVTLVCGMAMIIHPALGKQIRAPSGPTETDFATAFYVAGTSMTTAGSGDLAPRTPGFRIFYTFCSFLGISIITLTLTYLLEIYNSLQSRNTFALKLHITTAQTGDAAELLAGVGAQGRFDIGYPHLANLAAEMATFNESHHFYSALFYFRFAESHYAISRLLLVVLDTVSLIKSGLNDHDYEWLKESAAVTQLWKAAMDLATMLAAAFLPNGMPGIQDNQAPEPDEQTIQRWKQRYFAGLRRLRQAGITTTADESVGAENYATLRAQWDKYVIAFADHMAHDLANIDPAGTHPAIADERQEVRTRLRTAI
jgi:hypothetical protein